ncbi:hypothetical protein DSECCO2_417420 [anaerobic digester metagenome]
MNNCLNRQKKTISGVAGEKRTKNPEVGKNMHDDIEFIFKYIVVHLNKIKKCLYIEAKIKLLF